MTPDQEVQHPKRMTLSQVVELLLTRTPTQASVTISRNAKGDTLLEVVGRGDTAEEASVQAEHEYDRLAKKYAPPSNGSSGATVTLTRNAKGETQIGVEVKDDDPAQAEKVSHKVFESTRRKFPLSSGFVAAKAAKDDE